MWFKSCPKCRTGDVVLEKDKYGWHIQCIQCGFLKDLDNPYHAGLLLSRLSPGRPVVATTA